MIVTVTFQHENWEDSPDHDIVFLDISQEDLIKLDSDEHGYGPVTSEERERLMKQQIQPSFPILVYGSFKVWFAGF